MDRASPFCTELQERLRQNTVLLRHVRCPEEKQKTTSYVPADSWKHEVDKCYQRPNVKLRKAQIQLTQSLRNNSSSLRFYKNMGYLQRTCKPKTSTDTTKFSRNKDKTHELSQVRGTNSRLSTTPTYDGNCGPEAVKTDSNKHGYPRKKALKMDTPGSSSLNKYIVDQKHCAASVYLDFCTQNKPTGPVQQASLMSSRYTAQKTIVRDVNMKKHDFIWGVQRDKDLQKPCINIINQKQEYPCVLKRKEQADGYIRKDVTTKKLSVQFEGLSTRAPAADITTVKTADDWKRPLDLTEDIYRSRGVPRRFCRSCVKFQSDSERSLTPASNGVIPIQSSVDKAFMLVGNGAKPDLERAENSVTTRLRPKSAPAAAHRRRFQEMNSKLIHHICDVMETRGKLSLLMPRDRDKFFNIMLSDVEISDKDELLVSMFQNGLQKRMNCDI